MMSHNPKYYKVAGITLRLISDYSISENTFHPKFKLFEIPMPGVDMITIRHHFQFPEFDEKRTKKQVEVYKKAPFHIFKSKDSWTYQYTSIFTDDIVTSAIGEMNNDYSSIDIYTEGLTQKDYSQASFNALTLFNTDQMIFAKFLCDRNGLMVHSNGFNINGNGILLSGISGSGKSTLSGMLKKQNHKILCDDRMFIRKMGEEFWIFGNWCYGSHPDFSNSAAPLKGLLFLEKGTENQINEIKEKKEIAARLSQVLVRPLLDLDGWQKYFITVEELIKRVRFFRIEFDLSGTICNPINKLFGV